MRSNRQVQRTHWDCPGKTGLLGHTNCSGNLCLVSGLCFLSFDPRESNLVSFFRYVIQFTWHLLSLGKSCRSWCKTKYEELFAPPQYQALFWEVPPPSMPFGYNVDPKCSFINYISKFVLSINFEWWRNLNIFKWSTHSDLSVQQAKAM